ncbi:MAG: type II CAAX prenyl endopeptidase Rce1 family protein [Promethearchaeota archaeon]
MQLGENPWFLIGLTFLELLFILIPAFISSRIEKIPFKNAINQMGFEKNTNIFLKILFGMCFGIIFFFLSIFLSFFFEELLIGSLFGNDFVELAREGAINTTILQPNLLQLTILVLLQINIVAPCEEAFFRSFIIKKINTKLKITYSIVISSIIFSIYHIPPFLVPVPTFITFFGYYFIFGILLSLIFIYFKYSIIPCSIAHSFFNILIIII